MRCVNRYDKRWITTRRHPSASWTPNQSKRPKQATNAASTGEDYRNLESSEVFLYPGSIAIDIIKV
jgi:hypothetical protein